MSNKDLLRRLFVVAMLALLAIFVIWLMSGPGQPSSMDIALDELEAALDERTIALDELETALDEWDTALTQLSVALDSQRTPPTATPIPGDLIYSEDGIALYYSDYTFVPMSNIAYHIDWPYTITITDALSQTTVIQGPITVRFGEGATDD